MFGELTKVEGSCGSSIVASKASGFEYCSICCGQIPLLVDANTHRCAQDSACRQLRLEKGIFLDSSWRPYKAVSIGHR